MQVDLLPVESLDQRIAQAERRLVEREQRVRDGAARLKRGLSEQLAPSRWLPVVAASGGAWLLWKLLRRRKAPRAPDARDSRDSSDRSDRSDRSDNSDQASGFRGGGLMLGQLLTWAWPLVPTRWRQSLSPSLLISAASIFSALASSLLRARQSRSRPTPTPTRASPGS